MVFRSAPRKPAGGLDSSETMITLRPRKARGQPPRSISVRNSSEKEITTNVEVEHG